MSDVVLDASALLALLRGEPGASTVEAHLGRIRMSAVNLSETIAKLVEQGSPFEEAQARCALFAGEIFPFDETMAVETARLRSATRPFSLSLGDRACLALARTLGLVALTSDRRGAALRLDVRVQMIR